MIAKQAHRFARLARVLPAIAGAGIAVAAILTWIGALSPSAVLAQETNTADVIVQFDASDIAIRSIEFSDPISGLVALEKSGFDITYEIGSNGASICSIEGVGCNFPVEDCYCQCSGEGPCKYWGYYYWGEDAWQYYQTGWSNSVISQTGAIEGLRWGDVPTMTVDPGQAQSALKALTWIRGTQVVTEGGWGKMGSSVEAAFAIGANKEDAADWRAGEGMPSLEAYVMANAAGFVVDGSGASGKTVIASSATDICWPAGALRPSDYYSQTLGGYSEHMGFHIWGLLGALADGDEISAASIDTVKDGVLDNGGWEWMTGFGADSNTSALAVQALVAAGEPVTSTEIISALAFLKRAQNDDGGFTYEPESRFGTDSDTNSTAYGVQALWAAGQDPTGPGWTTSSGNTPISYLLAMQLNDGSFEWMPAGGTNSLSTFQAVPALLGNRYPMAVGIDECPALFLPQVSVK